MTFGVLTFCLFSVVVWTIFLVMPDRFRWLLLLAASYGFYGLFTSPWLPVLLAGVTIMTYGCGIAIGRYRDGKGAAVWLWGGIILNLGILVGSKSLSHLLAAITVPASSLTAGQTLAAVGASFYILQAICYLVDIFLGKIEPERHPGHFALYLAFFPKLIQGPIERAGDLLPQLKQPFQLDATAVREAILLVAGGVLKKMVIADRLALYVDIVYGNPHQYTGLPLICATWLYAVQIYFDFSGYTDMALGAARLFNIRLTPNFNSPYRAASIADFWRRWHISFSRWILDYIFTPLQMYLRRTGTAGTAGALIVTFLASGLWHGSSWRFVIWGGLHGIYLAGSILYRPYRKRVRERLGIRDGKMLEWGRVFLTFNLVCFAWIFFRASTLADAVYIATNVFNLADSIILEPSSFLNQILMTQANNLGIVAGAILLAALYRRASSGAIASGAVRNFIYLLVVLACLNLGVERSDTFVYMQF